DREKHLQRRNGELDREIDRLITNIAKGADFDTYNPKVNELAAERKRVKAELAQIAAASEIVTVHPAAIERYLADIRRLAEVAAEAANSTSPSSSQRCASWSKPSSFMRRRGPTSSQSRSRHPCRN
ncbi:MAG: hypothetical protein JOY90_10955, partial [Bradyrhizobium sp.]|nr:hypothetical protein [Bradyrhizobium sp.]